MGELISREAALDKALRHCRNCSVPLRGAPCGGCIVDVISGGIKQLPAVDAVEVVRCKDCIYKLPLPEDRAPYYGDWVMVCALGRGDPNKGQSVVWPDDFCSEGERRR